MESKIFHWQSKQKFIYIYVSDCIEQAGSGLRIQCETQFARGSYGTARTQTQEKNKGTGWWNEGDARLVPVEMDHCSGRWFDDQLLCQIKRSRRGDLRARATGRACRPSLTYSNRTESFSLAEEKYHPSARLYNFFE